MSFLIVNRPRSFTGIQQSHECTNKYIKIHSCIRGFVFLCCTEYTNGKKQVGSISKCFIFKPASDFLNYANIFFHEQKT
jgi:hypothetical protein